MVQPNKNKNKKRFRAHRFSIVPFESSSTVRGYGSLTVWEDE